MTSRRAPSGRLSACLVAAAAVLLAGCSSTGSAGTGSGAGGPGAEPPLRLGALALTPCGESDLVAGPEDAEVVAGGTADAAGNATGGARGTEQEDESGPRTHRFCGTLDSGADQPPLTVTVLSASARPDLERHRLLVWHPGGPGLSPAQILLAEAAPADLDRFVVLSWDGVAASQEAGACGAVSSRYGTERPAATAAQDAVAAGRECAASRATRLSGAPTDQTAAAASATELERLRSAVGAERLSLLTHSYGTAIAEQYLRAHPARVEAAVLDAPMLLAQPWTARVAAAGRVSASVVERMLSACRSASCSEPLRRAVDRGGYPEVRAAVLAAEPVAGVSGLPLTGAQLDQATLLAARDSTAWAPYLAAATAALAGDGTDLAVLAEQAYFGVDRATYYGVLCSDLQVPVTVDEILAPAEGAGPLARAFAEEFSPCAGVPREGPVRSAAVSTDPGPEADHVLVVASELDVLAPAPSAASDPSLRAWGLCRTVVPGHTSITDQPVRGVVTAFLVHPVATTALRSGACGGA